MMEDTESMIISTDVTFDTCTGLGAAGVKAINVDREVLATAYRRFQSNSVREVELNAIDVGLTLAYTKDYKNIRVEGDFKDAMDAVKYITKKILLGKVSPFLMRSYV
ncbi:hypothetical protein FRX31_023463 [Thalictrum thalictroides]|uniref:RNase H type-1 domain-containing protein n=1 Tax=Thalictrum thalictroides TaxID=46969 RepID=A0A7J6VRY5_THATH|nr:hypothetical protein FRX31_023463 [Thalictrum thalictroides]